jgi:hypothetical protein
MKLLLGSGELFQFIVKSWTDVITESSSSSSDHVLAVAFWVVLSGHHICP